MSKENQSSIDNLRAAQAAQASKQGGESGNGAKSENKELSSGSTGSGDQVLSTEEQTQEAQVEVEEEEYTQYIGRKSHFITVLKDGTRVPFVNFSFLTRDDRLISMLDREIAEGNRNLRKSDEPILSPKHDPLKDYRARIIAEHEASKQRAQNIRPGNTTKTHNVGAVNSGQTAV